MAGRQNPKEKEKMTAVPFPYPENMTDKDKKKFKKEKLKENQDKLYYDVRKNGQISNLIFQTQNYKEWMEVLRAEFPELEETEMGWFKFKDSEGTICVYQTGTIVVYGQLIDQFDEKFLQMKAAAAEAAAVAAEEEAAAAEDAANAAAEKAAKAKRAAKKAEQVAKAARAEAEEKLNQNDRRGPEE